MGSGIWLGGVRFETAKVPQARKEAALVMRTKVRDLEHHVARLSLMNQALWELIRDRLKLTDADLEGMARDVDLRDGVQDGEITDGAVQCPTCGRISNSKHHKCLYCGQEFAKPIMG